MNIYAIGDIHGQLGALRAAHDRIAADRARTGAMDAPVIHLGDLVDRGPDSRGVIESLIQGVARGEPWIVLKGNHDRMFREYLRDPHYHDPALWRELDWAHERLGGRHTLGSYGVNALGRRTLPELHADARAAVPGTHIEFLDQLWLYYETPELIFVHAGLRPGVRLGDQNEDDLLWIRDGFLDDPRDHGKLVVHGHTALNAPAHFGNRIDLDSGAGYGRPLTAAVFEGQECFILEDARRVKLSPTTH